MNSNLRVEGDRAYLLDDDGQIVATLERKGLTREVADAWAEGLESGYDMGFAAHKAIAAIKARTAATVLTPTSQDYAPLGGHLVIATSEAIGLTGSMSAGVFLTTAVRWAKRSKTWEFTATAKEWKAETGLTRNQIDNIRSLLEPHDLMLSWPSYDEKTKRVVLHYQINAERLRAAIEIHRKTGRTLNRKASPRNWRGNGGAA